MVDDDTYLAKNYSKHFIKCLEFVRDRNNSMTDLEN